ncbi:hypothetical protein NIES4071_08430 [Calothrix sp. NIES-4071]|nr:hypothetical protein NIES4071_08430 [Calothrix sp. NIES-4071]BAZ55185.1 hypothetical protein NIES4105_08390 [Calothrix sp. NIES-4105]
MNNRSDYDLPTEIISGQQEQNAISIPDSPHGRENLKWLMFR